MATVSIDRPGVQVIQEFQTVSPTILTPALPANILGPAFQVVEAVDDEGEFDSDALIVSPARLLATFVSSPFEYASIGGNDLVLSVNNGAPVTITFSTGPNLTATEAADDINEESIPGLLAEVEVSGTQQRLVLRTTLTGDNASLQVATGTAAAVLTAFGFTEGYTAKGSSGYTNYYQTIIQEADYPDPRDNLDELDIDYETVRVFLDDGASNVVEVLKTETFLQGNTSAVTVADDGDGDNLSPYLEFEEASFDGKAVLVGTVDWNTLTYPGDFGTFTFDILFDGGAATTVTFASPADASEALSQLNSGISGSGVAYFLADGRVAIYSDTTGSTSSVEIGSGGTIDETTIGFPVGFSATGGPSTAFASGSVDLTTLTMSTDVHNRVLAMSIDGDTLQQLVMPATISVAADIITEINNLWGAGVAALGSGNELELNSLATNGGVESVIRIDKNVSDSTLLTNLGLTTSGDPFETDEAVHGSPFDPAVGDEVWVDGVKLGEITELPVVAPRTRLRLDSEQLLTFTGSTWYIQAKNLDNSASTATRPSSDLIVDENSGNITVKHELFRDSAGVETQAGPLATYMAYTALRLDVSSVGEDFSLLRYGTTTSLDNDLAPLDTQNPLGLGMYFALLNAPGVEVTGLGLDDVSTSEPEGTLVSYTKAFEYLESKDVYAIAPLTHEIPVAQVGQAHVDELSEPENGLERCLLFNPNRPSRKADTLVASTATANVSGPPTNDVNTGIANLQTLLAAAGAPGPTYTESDGVFIEFEDDTNKYLVESVSGGVITVNDGPLSASNTIFYDGGGSPVFTSVLVDTPMSVKILGGTLSDLTDEATAYAAIAQGFKNRRVICTAPDKAKASIDGLDTLIEGYYLCCGLAGQMSSVVPQQGLTESPLTAFTGVQGSNDRYGEIQLKIMSGGGVWVFEQETDSDPVRTRHQLTTDMSTIEKREDSIRRILDFVAKTVRASLRTFVGGYNITTTVQDAINSTLDGIGRLLVRLGVLTAFNVDAIRQSSTAPDTLEIDVTVGVPYPLNYLKVTLIV